MIGSYTRLSDNNSFLYGVFVYLTTIFSSIVLPLKLALTIYTPDGKSEISTLCDTDSHLKTDLPSAPNISISTSVAILCLILPSAYHIERRI